MGSNRRDGVEAEILSDDDMFAGVDKLKSATPGVVEIPTGSMKCDECGHIDAITTFEAGGQCPFCNAQFAMKETAPALDKDGYPWDARIHGVKKNINANGTWRLIRKVDKDLVKQVRAESADAVDPEATKQGTDAPLAEETLPATTVPVKQGITADMVIAKFIETRDLIAEKNKALKVELTALKDLQEKRTNWLKGELDKLGVDSFKTKAGTCFVDMKDSATVADGEKFMNWIHEEWEERRGFLQNSVAKGAVKQRLEDGEVLPPGVKYTKFKDVKIRRA